MSIYKEIIKTLGENLSEYNVGAWALFRDQMATEISSQYIFSNGFKPDESLLSYSLSDIDRSNRLVKGIQTKTDIPRAPFTYYTSEGPKKELNSNPILPEPETDTLKIKSDFKVRLNETTISKTHKGQRVNELYDENGTIGGAVLNDGLGKDLYGTDITEYNNGETLLAKTKEWFKKGNTDYISKRFASTISRFHTDNNQIPTEELENSVATQAFSEEFGLSHGRNLRKKVVDNINGYNDPYCRVWTWHKQYHRLVKDTIRPFQDNGNTIGPSEIGDDFNWNTFRSNESSGFGNGSYRLQKYGVMFDNGGKTNGLVNITPSIDSNSTTYDDPRNVSVEHCMFSIENLAWKGTYGNWDDITEENGLSREQKGPLGGRIMWFPPYDLKFDERSHANWEGNDFIGRGEPIYTYANTERSGSLSFKLLIDHPAILDYWERRAERGTVENSGTDALDSKEQEMLRFFAGCDILRAGSTQPSSNPINPNPGSEEPTTKEGKTVQFFVFFPNNYSGLTDKVNGIVDPMAYLMNGAGTNKYLRYGSSTPQDMPTNVREKITDFLLSHQYGGYEMRSGYGVSIVTGATTNEEIIAVKQKNETYQLVKMVGNKAEKAPTGTSESWNKRRYYYRVDDTEDVLNQVLKGDEDNGAVSYIDKVSYQFNSVGYRNAAQKLGIKDMDSTYSFAEIFLALKGDDKDDIFTGLYDQERVTLVRSILNGEKGKILKIVCKGRASSQGNNPNNKTNKQRNNKLSSNRARTVREWLRDNISDKSIEYAEDVFTVDTDKNHIQDNSNDEWAKLNRFVFVEITYDAGESESADDAQAVITSDGTIEGNSATISNLIDNVQNLEPNTPTEEKNNNSRYADGVRYDNEARFFQKLTENEPFITKLLSERINNFDPVFHSMSPEGFNARLTFLNQCMRQGPTISSSDTKGWNANNLAFGRPPVCVLRVGDFYNTKVIITDLTITYDPLMWDLNEEGIGVMPMIANVTLNFNFIGGSDLAGPIQRLQNATSFNYYANAGVYDNRAEEIHYEDGVYDNFKAFET